jgi:hypothetical protein
VFFKETGSCPGIPWINYRESEATTEFLLHLDRDSSCSRSHQLIIISALLVRGRMEKSRFQRKIGKSRSCDYPFPTLLLWQERRQGAIFFPYVQ